MFRSRRPALIASVAVALTLLVASCSGADESQSSTEADKQDFSAGSDAVGTITAIGNAVFGAATYGDDDTMDCGDDSTSVNPIAVVNTYPTEQSLSITINEQLAAEVNFFTQPSWATGCAIGTQNAGTTNITVPPADSDGTPSFTVIGVLGAGGSQYDTLSNFNLAIGAGGTQWYDFYLHALFDAFENFELNYSNTGGTDSSQNVQTGLFNGLACSANSSGNISLNDPAQLTTPYSSDAPNAWEFTFDEPICFGFLQPGSFDGSSPS